MLTFKTVNSVCFLVLIGMISFHFISFPIPFYYYILLFLVWLILTIIGSFNILLNYFLKAHSSNKSIKSNEIAITFDDGPHPKFTPKVLELLKKHNAKATFFLIGKNAKQYPEIVKKIIEDGHTIGNHTFNHSTNFGFLNTKQVIDELNQTDTIIASITNKKLHLFRPPFGVTNPSIAKAVKRTEHQVIGWNNRSLDTKLKQESKIFNRITRKLQKGDIILLHDTTQRTINVLEQLLQFTEKQNYTSVTVDRLLNLKAYE